MTGPDDTRAFLELARQGDGMKAIWWAFDRYLDDITQVCQAFVREEDLATDLARESFLRAAKGLPAYSGEASPKTWLIAIAKNLCIDHLRKTKRAAAALEELGDQEALDDSDSEVEDVLGSRESLRSALESLSERDRALVILRVRYELDYSVLAEAFDTKPGTIRMRTSRALKKIRESCRDGEAILESRSPSGPKVADMVVFLDDGLPPEPTPLSEVLSTFGLRISDTGKLRLRARLQTALDEGDR